MASGDEDASRKCPLEEEICFPSPRHAFTPRIDAKCLVTLAAQAETETVGEPGVTGPLVRLEVEEDGARTQDAFHSSSFESTTGEESSAVEHTRLIDVKSGHEYAFGVAFAGVGRGWGSKEANYQITYVCFG